MSTAPDEARTVRLRVICLTPSPITWNDEPATFGLQDKQQELELGQRQPDGSIHYSCDVNVKRQAHTDHLRFSGPFVYGLNGDQFLYLGWRRVSEPGVWLRRWKIMLASISWEQLLATGTEDQGFLEASVKDMTKARAVLLDKGWTVRN